MAELALLETVDGVASVTLNRPDRLNAMTAELLEDTLKVLEVVAADKSVRVVILKSAGRAFCVGGDLAAGLEGINGPPPLTSQTATLRRYMRITQLLHDMPQLTIASINGACAGAGLSLACACDLRIASDGAVFNTAFLSAGVSGDFGGIWLVTQMLGTAMARQLFFSSPRLSAEAAHSIGLVGEVVPLGELSQRADEIARQFADQAPLALGRMKENLNDAQDMQLLTYLEREAARHTACCASEDAAEAARAYLEKRKPLFHGR
jgi:2-(1,2-epoxy-1,2-dihydrophenyl)acetyl-CoA isomerase